VSAETGCSISLMQLNGGPDAGSETARRHDHVAQARDCLEQARRRRGGLASPGVKKPWRSGTHEPAELAQCFSERLVRVVGGPLGEGEAHVGPGVQAVD
jgi:hypothetical protein